ncbi:hypothetical protein SISNIDRAFT_485220 [Sistotremastrum niveocremeum HHB9708]|uniref:RNase III domain-containing protein n=1 Tax=Sistotremastrum niveocremeum HHB9708 TaxID=1314777 RepID=A0A164UWN6_9AGAM|nr:hypothetical protein SISNIDRAFT_485220 [Sistotremastrum niveocremeum HHB9708]
MPPTRRNGKGKPDQPAPNQRRPELPGQYHPPNTRSIQDRDSVQMLQQTIYRLKIGELRQPVITSPRLERIIFNCHPTAVQQPPPDLPWVTVEMRLDEGPRLPTNKIYEFGGDALLGYVIPRVAQRFGQNRSHFDDMTRRLQRNFIMAHFVIEMELLSNRFLQVSPGDLAYYSNWNADHLLEAPKWIANLFESWALGIWLNHGLQALIAWLVPVVTALHHPATAKAIPAPGRSPPNAPLLSLQEYNPGHRPACENALTDFIYKNRQEIWGFGKCLRKALSKVQYIEFGADGKLISQHADTITVGTGLFKFNIFSGWIKERMDVLLSTKTSLVIHIHDITRLIMTEPVLAHIAYALGLDIYVSSQHHEGTFTTMANVLICAVGYFDRECDDSLFDLEPMLELVVEGAAEVIRHANEHPVMYDIQNTRV